MWAILPAFLLFYSERLRDLIPFIYFEIWLLLVFVKIIYDIFDWYNDVLIVTDEWVVQLERALFRTDSISVNFEKIEWIEVEQIWVLDKILQKWDLIIHKFWDDIIELKNAISPYKWVDMIEEFSEQYQEFLSQKDDKFDIIMDALGWVVENYLSNKTQKTEKEMELEETIEKARNKKWTIDLR